MHVSKQSGMIPDKVLLNPPHPHPTTYAPDIILQAALKMQCLGQADLHFWVIYNMLYSKVLHNLIIIRFCIFNNSF